MKSDKFIITARKTVLFVLYFTIVMETLISQFKFPSFIRYINDIAIIILLYFMRLKTVKKFKEIKSLSILISLLILFLCFFISSITNLVPFHLAIWAIRNTFRGIIFMIACICFLKKEDLYKIFNNLFIFQIINVLLGLYQFFILGHSMDFVGGIFGYGNGAGVNIFNALLISYYLNTYLQKKEKLIKLIIVTMTSFILAAIAEEKMTYIFFIIIVLISILFNKISLRKIVAINISIIVLLFGLKLINLYYPDMYEIMTNKNLLIEYSTKTYEEGYRIPRLGAFKFIDNKFFFNNVEDKMLGLGFGNCETSNIKIFESEFYKIYGDYNYRWFTHQWIYLECGIIGFMAYIIFFIVIILNYIKKLIKIDSDKYFIIAGLCMTVCCIMTIWYNATLKVDMSYLAFFSISIGFVSIKNNKENEVVKICH